MHKLHGMLVQEETRLKNQENYSIHHVNYQDAGKKVGKRNMERFTKNGILSVFDFTDLNICVNCIKGK